MPNIFKWLRGRASVTIAMILTVALGSGVTALGAHASPPDQLSAIQKAGVITVGVAQDPPFAFTTTSGEWTSLVPILDRRLAAYLGVKIRFVATGWTGIVAGLQTGKYDIIGASINATPERRKVIDFSRPYYYTGTSFFARADNTKKLTSVARLNRSDVTVAAVTGSDNQTAVEKYLPKAKLRALPNASIASLISEVVSGRSDALATSTYLAPALIAKYHFVVAPPLAQKRYGVLPVGVAWGIPKNQPRLRAKINAFLASEINSGRVATLQKVWLTPQNSLK